MIDNRLDTSQQSRMHQARPVRGGMRGMGMGRGPAEKSAEIGRASCRERV